MARGSAEARGRPAPRRGPAQEEAGPLGAGALFLLFLALLGVAAWIFAPALRGPFVSDDLHYVATNPYVHEASLESLGAILDPTSAASVFVVNYTPVHLLLHQLQWQLFGPDTFGYHVTNVVLHALGAVLLVAVFQQSGLRRGAAVAGGLLFLVHPANVEAVAWVSQLKTSACLVLSLVALLLFPARPGAATAVLLLALLAKPTAAFLLPVNAVLTWVRVRERGPARQHWLWLAVQVVGFLALAVAQLEVNRRSGTPDTGLAPEGLARVATVAVIALRYLVMSATSLGVSAFHEPDPVASPADLRFWLAAVVLLVVAARAAVVLWRRREEAVFWTWAAASFLPVSQIFPFLYPMADRYLYFILPGLLGAVLWMLQSWLHGLPVPGDASRLPVAWRRRAGQAGLALALGLAAVFAVRGHERAALWRTPALLLVDAARNYPEGVSAHLLAARRAARLGDAAATVEALRAAERRGFNRFEQLQSDPAFAPVRSDPRFRAVVRDLAAWWIARSETLPEPTQMELRVLALAHLARGEREQARAALGAALQRGGPIDDRIRSELRELGGAAP